MAERLPATWAVSADFGLPTVPRSLGLLFLAVASALVLGISASASAQAANELPTYTVVRSVLVPSNDGSSVDSESVVVAQFVVNTNLWDTGSLPVPVRYNSSSQIAGGHDMPGIISHAVDTWNAAAPQSFAFTYEGATENEAGSCDSTIHLDGVNTISFAPLNGQLGITCTVYLGSGATSKLVEFDMQISDNANWWSSTTETASDKFDLPSTVLHELGHAAGLSHSTTSTVMDGTLKPGSQQRTLTADDVAGLQFAYPLKTYKGKAAAASRDSSPVVTAYQLRAAFVAFD